MLVQTVQCSRVCHDVRTDIQPDILASGDIGFELVMWCTMPETPKYLNVYLPLRVHVAVIDLAPLKIEEYTDQGVSRDTRYIALFSNAGLNVQVPYHHDGMILLCTLSLSQMRSPTPHVPTQLALTSFKQHDSWFSTSFLTHSYSIFPDNTVPLSCAKASSLFRSQLLDEITSLMSHHSKAS